MGRLPSEKMVLMLISILVLVKPMLEIIQVVHTLYLKEMDYSNLAMITPAHQTVALATLVMTTVAPAVATPAVATPAVVPPVTMMTTAVMHPRLHYPLSQQLQVSL